MGRTTILRQSVKTMRVNEVSITEILHPFTKDADPASLILTEDVIITQIIAGDLSELKYNGSAESTTNTKVQADLDNAETIYTAFSIDSKQENPTVALLAAIDAYGVNITINRDDYELQTDIANDTIKVLKLNGASKEEIDASYIRVSIITGIITLELLATSLEITFDEETTDAALATLIKEAIVNL